MSLADASLWSEGREADDPFDDRPLAAICPASAWGVEVVADEEGGVVEVDTGLCGYLSITQPSTSAVAAGTTVHVRVGHDVLEADEPAEAHVALLLGDVMIWEARLVIPAEATRTGGSVVLQEDVPEGTPLWFHLHNHGANTWNLLGVGTGPLP